MTTTIQQRAAVMQVLQRTIDVIEQRLEQARWREQAAKNWAAMTPAQRKVITAKVARLELNLAIFQATQAARPQTVVRKTAPAAQRPTATRIQRQAQELLQSSRARKTAPAECAGIVCGHMRTPTGGRR